MINNKLYQLLLGTQFPRIEAVSAESSNVNGDSVSAYAVTNVTYLNAENQIKFLIKLIEILLSEKENSLTIETIQGFSYTGKKPDTYAYRYIKKHIKNPYDKTMQFTVIWLKTELDELEYRGWAGHETRKYTGIVLNHPDESSMQQYDIVNTNAYETQSKNENSINFI